jgi:16S rRNA (guanine527-N7)-methyltransferase
VISALGALRAGAARILGRPVTDAETDLFRKYLTLLLKWQKIHRFVGSDDPEWIVRRLLLDSLLFLRVLPADARHVLDVGSGAGIPGIPLKLVRPALSLTMVESRRRRASFLTTVVRELDLTDARVIADRLEAVMSELGDRFDAVVARCAGDLSAILEVGSRIVRPGGGVVVVSGPPEERPLSIGGWIAVDGLRQGEIRRFAVYVRP